MTQARSQVRFFRKLHAERKLRGLNGRVIEAGSGRVGDAIEAVRR